MAKTTNTITTARATKALEAKMQAVEAMQNNMIQTQEVIMQNIADAQQAITAMDERLKHQEDVTNTLGFGYHSKEFTKLKATYLSRVRNELLSPMACGDEFKAGNYTIAWKPFFMSWINHDICRPFGVSKIGNIKTEDFEAAMDIAQTWRPSTHKLQDALERVKALHFVKPFDADRWSAFRHYMADTNDGQINPWA